MGGEASSSLPRCQAKTPLPIPRPPSKPIATPLNGNAAKGIRAPCSSTQYLATGLSEAFAQLPRKHKLLSIYFERHPFKTMAKHNANLVGAHFSTTFFSHHQVTISRFDHPNVLFFLFALLIEHIYPPISIVTKTSAQTNRPTPPTVAHWSELWHLS